MLPYQSRRRSSWFTTVTPIRWRTSTWGGATTRWRRSTTAISIERNRRQYLKDIGCLQMLERLGWAVVRVVAEDHPLDVVNRIRQALISRGYRET